MPVNVTRFAPSPNGPLHLGHAFSAIVAHDLAKERGGRFLLGLEWEEVPPQSTRLGAYAEATERLRSEGLLYPCRCTRAEIAAAATKTGPDGPIYPGTCHGASFAA